MSSSGSQCRENKKWLFLLAKGTASSTESWRNTINPGKTEVSPAFLAQGVLCFLSIAELGKLLTNEKMTNTASHPHWFIVQSMLIRVRFFLQAAEIRVY